MSLVGRLDDLSLADIIQIVHLSRRTGTLEIVDHEGLHALLFSRGLIVNGSSPNDPDLIAHLVGRELISASASAQVAQLRRGGVPAGDALIDLNAISADVLATAVRDRILAMVQPLLQSHEGEFSFRLNESLTPFEIGFDPKRLFKEGGLTPQKIFGNADKEKLKPLRGLEESLKAGKALMSVASAPPVMPTPKSAEPEPFTVAEKPVTDESEELPSVVVFERNAMLRVAIKRGFVRERVKIAQFGAIDDARSTVNDLLAAKRFFVTVVERTCESDSLLRFIKRRNPRLPVIAVEGESGMSAIDADRRVRKPDLSGVAPADHARELGMFADDVVLSAQYALTEWNRISGGAASAATHFYDRSDAENLARRCGAVRQLISGLSSGNDIGDVATTMLRLFEDYVDRGALFISGADDFIGVGGFGVGNGGVAMHDRIARTKIARSEPSILSDVAASLAPHHGKLRRTDANVQLLEAMGGALPTEVVALPIVYEGATLGVVYGDNAHHRAPIESTSAVEVFLFHAADAFATALYGPEKVRVSG